MIQRPNNWDSISAPSDRPKLPVGAYVCRIRQAAIKNESYGDVLALLFDIEDGEYARYYQDMFASDTREDKKWKGVLRVFLPKNDGSEKDDWTASTLKGLITSIEHSNPGYTWNWDERSLANKLIGIVYRNEEWEHNGKTGWSARPYRACGVDSVQDGTYYQPKDKPLKKSSSSGYDAPAASSFTDYSTDDDLPF